MPSHLPATATHSQSSNAMDGNDAPMPLPATSSSRPEEGLQHRPEVEYSVEYADTQQAPSPFPENDGPRRQSIPWDTHPRRFSNTQDNHWVNAAQEENPRPDSIAWDRSRGNGTVQTGSPSFLRRQTDPPRPELDSEAPQNSTETLPQPKEIQPPENAKEHWWGHPYLNWVNPRRKYWRYILPVLTLCLLALLVAFLALYLHTKKNGIAVTDVITIITSQSSALPLTDSALGATTITYGSYFTNTASNFPDSKLVYTTSNGSICIRTFTANAWLANIQCITNLHPKPHTPLAILDWLGGPSIYFISTANQLCGIDNVPSNNTWKLSSLNSQVPPVQVHPNSQLATVTWLNGTSAWLYYQDSNLQLREYGLDDYRDTEWRDGALGPLGVAQQGSGIGTARYLVNGSEVLEVFIQTDNDAVHGRVYMDSVWEANFYSVDGTTSGLPSNAALTATTVEQPTAKVVLAWVSSTGFVNIQSRNTVNVTQYNAFSDPKQLVEGDGGLQPGLAATGGPKIYFASGQKMLELEVSDVLSANWTTIDVTSL